jgi:hypothetical protein
LINLVGIIGEPLSGKSRAAAAIMERSRWNEGFAEHNDGSLLYGVRPKARLIVVGDYSRPEQALPPSAPKRIPKLLEEWAATPAFDGYFVLLDCGNFLPDSFFQAVEAIPNVRAFWVVLGVSQAVLQERRGKTNLGETSAFLAARRDAIWKFAQRGGVVNIRHHTDRDTASVADLVQGWMNLHGNGGLRSSLRADQEANPGKTTPPAA